MEEIIFVKNRLPALLKSMLSCGPTYCFLLFAIPTFVANRLERFQRNFLWGDLGDEFKFHSVEWNMICSPKNGGFECANWMLSINLCCVGEEVNHLWRWEVDLKDRKIWINGYQGWSQVRMMLLYTRIRAGWDSFVSYVQFEIGDGLRFWHNLWCGNQSLKELYMKLYALAINKHRS